MTRRACVRASIAMFKVVSASAPSVWRVSKDQDVMFSVGDLLYYIIFALFNH